MYVRPSCSNKNGSARKLSRGAHTRRKPSQSGLLKSVSVQAFRRRIPTCHECCPRSLSTPLDSSRRHWRRRKCEDERILASGLVVARLSSSGPDASGNSELHLEFALILQS